MTNMGPIATTISKKNMLNNDIFNKFPTCFHFLANPNIISFFDKILALFMID